MAGIPQPQSNRPEPVVVAAAALTALGSLDETWQGLLAGRCGLRPLPPLPGLPAAFPVGRIESAEGELGSPARLRCLIDALCQTPALAGIAAEGDLVAATTKGAADEMLAPGETTWQGQAWQVGALAAAALGCRGRTQTVSAACASGTLALIHAAQRIRSGQATVVSVIGIDILSRFVLAGFASLQALDPLPCRPFGADRQGLSLGEGAGLLILAAADFAAARGLPVLARIKGWGAASDATHITAPSRDGSGLQAVIRQATGNGTLPVGGVNGHGTGTRYNDAMEMTAFAACWPKPPPIHSVKGALGHCLGAAGVIEAAVALRSLGAGMIPPTVGHTECAFANARISGRTAQPLDCPTLFTCNSGFGGINAGIFLAAP